MIGVNEVRSTFIDYFARHDHEIVPSSPLVPRNDPSLMFTNAGMVQFKNVFTGVEKRSEPRAVTSQKCVRAGGKHNDLDNVGYTARHHTFFEMLGNFSFGDYFKERAIELAWGLVTKEFGLAADRLLVTVYSEDEDAAALWRKIAGLSDDRIIRIPTSDNFWTMGETGPCGPCSEIFYDHGDHVFGGPPGSADEDGDRFTEIWNLVFMQYDQVTPDERVNLPRPSIDTGMGLERMSAVLQGVHDNYDTDLFKTLIAAIEDAVGSHAEGDRVASHRVIADHLRATAFLIADGVLPSNEGRGYVLRRIMRRAMRHAKLLGADRPVIYKALPTLVAEMGRAFPELYRTEALISETLEREEKRFLVTLDRGLSLLGEATEGMGTGDKLAGETAFKLYDTYGFPLDLTQDALRQRGISVDLDAFETAMERQRREARASWTGSGDSATQAVWLSARERIGTTEFLGYETERAGGVVQALVVDGVEVERVEAGTEVAVALNQTPFYGESGGQLGDTGVMRGEGVELAVSDTQRVAGIFVHRAKVTSGALVAGMALDCEVDHVRRGAIRSNHSATHLIHESLREVLGGHVAQKGSMVAGERLRFDFSHPKPLSQDEIDAVETMANDVILQDAPVETRLMAVDDAIESGAMALFGEKYGDEVRVVSMGTAEAGDKAGKTFSIELCGGTHVRATGEIGLVHIVSESAVGAGVRRIEALTGNAARRNLVAQDRRVLRMAAAMRVTPDAAAERLDTLLGERRQLERDLADAKKRLALAGDGGGAAAAAPTDVGGVGFLGRVIEGVAAKDLKGLVDEAKTQVGSGVVAFVGVDAGKASVVVGVTEDLTARFDAVALVRGASAAIGGKGGGGRPDLAQAGGPNASDAQAAVDAVSNAMRETAPA